MWFDPFLFTHPIATIPGETQTCGEPGANLSLLIRRHALSGCYIADSRSKTAKRNQLWGNHFAWQNLSLEINRFLCASNFENYPSQEEKAP